MTCSFGDDSHYLSGYCFRLIFFLSSPSKTITSHILDHTAWSSMFPIFLSLLFIFNFAFLYHSGDIWILFHIPSLQVSLLLYLIHYRAYPIHSSFQEVYFLSLGVCLDFDELPVLWQNSELCLLFLWPHRQLFGSVNSFTIWSWCGCAVNYCLSLVSGYFHYKLDTAFENYRNKLSLSWWHYFPPEKIHVCLHMEPGEQENPESPRQLRRCSIEYSP